MGRLRVFSELLGGERVNATSAPSAACNVAAIVKAYYVAALRDGSNAKPVEELTKDTLRRGGAVRKRRSRQIRLPPKKAPAGRDTCQITSFRSLFELGVLTTARDVMIVTWLHDGWPSYRWTVGFHSRISTWCDTILVDSGQIPHSCGWP